MVGTYIGMAQQILVHPFYQPGLKPSSLSTTAPFSRTIRCCFDRMCIYMFTSGVQMIPWTWTNITY
ncbi:MAG TPA: hypothetical protein DEP00_02300 [Lachnospiraceae bacterium]|nr:hypothetical protein [Lachnospiraceae bacterium]